MGKNEKESHRLKQAVRKWKNKVVKDDKELQRLKQKMVRAVDNKVLDKPKGKDTFSMTSLANLELVVDLNL